MFVSTRAAPLIFFLIFINSMIGFVHEACAEIIIPEETTPAYKWTPDSIDRPKIDPSCDEAMIYEFGLRQSCYKNANGSACTSLGLHSVVAAYITTGNLKREQLGNIVFNENYDQAIKAIEGYKEKLDGIQNLSDRQLAEAERIHNQIVRIIEADHPATPAIRGKNGKNEIPAKPFRPGKPIEKWTITEIQLYEKTFSAAFHASPLMDDEAKAFFLRRPSSNVYAEPTQVVDYWRENIKFHTARRIENSFAHIGAGEFDEINRQISAKTRQLDLLLDRPYGKDNDAFIEKLTRDLQKLYDLRNGAFDALSPIKSQIAQMLFVVKETYKQVGKPRGSVADASDRLASAVETLKVDKVANEKLRMRDFETRQRLLAREESRAIEARLRPKILVGGAVDVALAFSHLTDDITLNKCSDQFKLTKAEKEYLKAGWIRQAKVTNTDGLFAPCENVVISEPSTIFEDMKKKFGGVPEATCKLLKQSQAQLEYDSNKLAHLPPGCGGIAETKDWTLQKTSDGYVLTSKYKNGTDTFEIQMPSINLQSASSSQIGIMKQDIEQHKDAKALMQFIEREGTKPIPYFRFSEVKISKSVADGRINKSVENKIATMAMKDFYQKIHPANVPDLRPDLIDTSINCKPVRSNPINYKEEVRIFCDVRENMMQARSVIAKGMISQKCEYAKSSSSPAGSAAGTPLAPKPSKSGILK